MQLTVLFASRKNMFSFTSHHDVRLDTCISRFFFKRNAKINHIPNLKSYKVRERKTKPFEPLMQRGKKKPCSGYKTKTFLKHVNTKWEREENDLPHKFEKKKARRAN
jgi:hypothetical protein